MSGPHEGPLQGGSEPTQPPWSPPTTPPGSAPTPPPGYGGWASPPADPTALGGSPVGPPPPPPAEAPSARPPQVGDQLGPYRLDAVLTTGSTATVFVATDQRLGRQVAVEVVTTPGLSPQDAARFGDDAARLARLDSPHVLAVYDHGNAQGWPWQATRYAPGGDLATMVRNRGAMPPALAARVGSQVADGLTDAHAAGILHGALRPEAVLLRDDRPDRMHVYVSDFGSTHGPAAYRAPELSGGAPVSPRSDVYAVGCLLHEVLTGRPPFAGATDAEVDAAHRTAPIPQLTSADPAAPELNRVLTGALAKDPAHRYPSAAALRDDLRDIAGRHSTSSTPAAPPAFGGSPTAPRRRRGLLLGGIAAGVVLLLVAGGVAFAVLRGDDPEGGGGGGGGGGGEPEPAVAVAGDLNDDGFGDVWSVSEYEPATTLPSDGSGFGKSGRDKQVGAPSVIGDADGDGVLDVIEIEGTSGSATAQVHLSDGTRQSAILTIPTSENDYLDLAAADLDADGDDDLVVITQRSSDQGRYDLGVSMLEEGRPTPLEPLTGLDLDGIYDGVAAGDFDGDGTDDLAFKSTAAQGNDQLDLLRGADGALEDPVVSVLDYAGEEYYYAQELHAGDLDGDGTDELVMDSPDGSAQVVALDESGEQFGPAEFWVSPGRGEEDYSLQSTLSDVDGDGSSDLVRIGEDSLPKVTEVTVLRSTGSQFEEDAAFTGVLRVEYPQLLGTTFKRY